MPKTAVDKCRNLESREGNVDLASLSFDPIVGPVAKTSGVQQPAYRNLRLGIALALRCHAPQRLFG